MRLDVQDEHEFLVVTSTSACLLTEGCNIGEAPIVHRSGTAPILLPALQSYERRCQCLDQWSGGHAWILWTVQRMSAPARGLHMRAATLATSWARRITITRMDPET